MFFFALGTPVDPPLAPTVPKQVFLAHSEHLATHFCPCKMPKCLVVWGPKMGQKWVKIEFFQN